jgi:hypothetical protein
VTSKSQDTFAKAGKTKVTTNGAVKQTADAPTAALTTKTAPQVASKSAQQALADPKVRAQIAEMRTRIHSTLGQVVLAMAALPRYRYLSLVDLQAIVLEPLIRDSLVEYGEIRGQCTINSVTARRLALPPHLGVILGLGPRTQGATHSASERRSGWPHVPTTWLNRRDGTTLLMER